MTINQSIFKPIMRPVYHRDRGRHIAEGKTLVLHCHHFAALTTQLANDCSLLNAKKLLAECAEDAFHTVLTDYYRLNGVGDLKERIWAAERYFSECGLGKLKVSFAGVCSGEVKLLSSHVDEGWVKKWGVSLAPVNYIGCGYVTALFSAVFDKPKRFYSAKERQSIACGAPVSVITVTDAMDRRGN